MNAAENPTPPKWTDIANDPDFQAADWQTKQRVRGEFYRRAIEPQVPESLRADVQSQFFTRTEADVFGDREEKPAPEDSLTESPNLASNALRNAGERGLDLAGNALQFVGNMADRGEKAITDALGGINPGVIGGSSDEMRERGYEPDVELGGFGLDFTMRAKPEDTSTGLIDTGQAVEDISLGYQPNYTIDRALDEPSIKTIAGAAAEQGPAALADMAGLVVSLPAYLAARTQEIGEGRVENDGLEGMPEGRDYAVSGPTAAASVLLDRFALGRLLPGGKNAVTSARQIPGAVSRAAGTEGVTEALQEGGIEYTGESVGTEAGWDPVTAGRRAAGGVIVGAPTGGAVRGGTAVMEMRGNNRQGGELSEPSETSTEQPSPAPGEASAPEAETANVEAIGTAAELIARPRFELSSAEREVRDSISYGDAFKALRAAAEERGDSDAVAELDAVSGEISAALEAETMARTRNDSEAFTAIREQLQSASERFTRVMDRLNAPASSVDSSQERNNEDSNAEWEEAWREQAAEDGIADYDPNTDLPDTTIDIEGQQDESTPTAVNGPLEQASDQPSANPDRMLPRRVPVERINVDPEAYQFRTDVNEVGVDSRLAGVKSWDDLRAGNLILHERLDGSLFAADGHHRINLAKQLSQPDVNAIVLREADGVTVEDARREAAEANIAAGNATAIDAAKVFRNSEEDTSNTIAQRNLPRSQVVRDGIDIAKLEDEPFGAVLNQVVTEKDGAAIGRAFEDADQQLAAIDVFQRVKPTNENQRAILVNEIRQAGFANSQNDQMGMFGDDPAQSLIGERVRLMDNLRQSLVRDRRLFATLNDNAQTAEQAGNRIARDQNEALQDASAQAVDLLQRATTTPEINQQINDAARRVNEGESLSSVTRELKEALLNGPNATATKQSRTPASSDGSTPQTRVEQREDNAVPGRDDSRAASAGEQRLDVGEREQTAGNVTLKADGSPFQTRRAVELSKRFRESSNAEPVEVEGGWGFTSQQTDATRTGQSSRSPQRIKWQRRSNGSRVWEGSDGTVIADRSISSGGNRIPLFMVFADQQAFYQGDNFTSGKSLTEAKHLASTVERPAQQQEAFLESQTEESLAQREQQRQQAERADAQQRQTETQRAQADRDLKDFSLTGSDRQADVLAAGGQSDLLGAQPSLESATQSTEQPSPKSTRPRKPAKLTPRQQRVSDAFGGAMPGDTINLLTDVGYSKAGNAYTIDSINKDGTLQATNIDRGSSVLISQGDWTLASRRTKAPIAEVIRKGGQGDQSGQEAMYSLRSVVRGNGKEKGVSLEEAQRIADAFMADYNGHIPLDIMVVNRQEDAYGAAATRDKVGIIKGAYHSGSGKLVLVAANLRSARDGRETLRHEVVGHFGLNTFEPAIKRRILDRILETEKVPSLRPAWRHVNRHYPADTTPADIRAEEVFAYLAEREKGRFGAAWDRVLSLLNRAMRQTGLSKHPLSRAELHYLASTISKEIRDGRRQQRTFPATDQDQFQKDDPEPLSNNAEPNAAQVNVSDIKSTLKSMLELADTRVIQSATELPTDALMGMMLRGISPADVRGMFVGGELYVVADNMASVDEAVRTAVHESVGHKGIRGVLGAELEPLMLEVYKSHTRSQAGRDNIAAIQSAYPFIDVTTHEGKVTLAEELVAHYIEDSNGSPTLSQRIKSTVRRLLRKLFPNIEWRTNDILALGEQSRRWLRRQQAQRDLASQDETLYSLMEQQSSITHRELSKQLRDEYPGLKLDMAGRGQRVTISRIVSPKQNEGIGSDVMRRLSQWADASGKTLALTPSVDFGGNVKRLREFYKRFGFIENKGRNKDYEISESMYRTPDYGVGEQRFSLNKASGTIGGNFSSTDSTNFAMPDEALTETAIRKMADKMRPLKILEDAIRRSGREIEEEADVYLAEELFHGKAEYDLRQLREQYVEPLAKGLARAKISQADLDEYLYARHAPERNATIAERNPDKPDMQDGGSGMTNARAAEIMEKVANSGKQAEYDRLAKIVYDMTRLRRDAIREGGLEDDTVVDAWEAAWQYYVPLKGNAADEPGRPKTGRGFEVSGRESRTAAGRKSIADSPSSQVIVDANESLIRRRKNEVAQSLLSLVTDHPNPSLWEVFTDNNPDTQRTPVTITDPDTGKSRIEVQDRPVNMAGNDKYFKVKRAGRTYYLKIHDERLMNAMRNVGPENNGLLIRMASTATRAMSAMMTSYNPEFMLTNFTRDVQTALLNLTAEQTRDDGKIKGEAIVRQTARDIGPAMKAAWRGLQNKLGKNDSGREWDTWFKEFQEDGAKTGYFDMKDISSQAKEIQSMVRRADGTTMSHMLKARKKTADFVENMNGAVENAVRLSAYANARRAGVSRKQAASLAKNMTVNFNRRGEAGTALNAAYMFANASVQGTMNFARTMITAKNTPDGKSPMNVWARANMAQKLAFGMASGAFALGMLNRWASEEDEDGVLFYDKVPDHVKERNIVIMSSLWGGEPEDFVSIPLPYGYNVFSVIGTHAEAVTSGTLDATEAGKNLGLAILGSFSPIGWEDSDSATGLFMKNLTPTLVRSFAQVGFNEDFAGRMIYREDLPFGTPTPDSSRAMPSTPEPYKAIASFLNDLTGGSEYRTGSVDINPDVMQHLVNYYGGGAWGFVEKSSSFAARVATGEEVERYRIPFAGRFASSTSPYRDQGLFYERRDELGQIANEADALKGRERIEFRRDHIEQIRLFNRAKNIEKQLQEYRKQRDRIQENETLSDEAKKNRLEMIERQMKRRVDDFNRRYNELSD